MSDLVANPLPLWHLPEPTTLTVVSFHLLADFGTTGHAAVLVQKGNAFYAGTVIADGALSTGEEVIVTPSADSFPTLAKAPVSDPVEPEAPAA